MAKAKAKKAKNSKRSEAAGGAKPERYVLDWRECDLPTSIHFRTQNHGDDKVKATDIRVSGIELSKEEVEQLSQEKYATRILWATAGRGKPERPTLERFEPLRLSDPIETARVSIRVGGEEVKLGPSRLKAITLDRKPGGVVLMSCMVQSTPTINGKLAELIDGMDGKARIQIEYEHNAEQIEAFDADGEAKGDSELEKFERDSRAQVDAFNRGTPGADSQVAETH